MAILTVSPNSPGESGQKPSFIYIDTDSTADDVVATGFLNGLISQGIALSESQMAVVTTKTSPNSRSTQSAVFNIVNNNGVWSLVPSNSDTVTVSGTPTTGNLAKFFSDNVIEDAGVAPTDLVTYTGSLIANTIPKASGTGGELVQGYTPSNFSLPNLASLNGAFVAGNVADIDDNVGTIRDSGVPSANIPYKYGRAAFGGGGVQLTVTVAGMVGGDTIIATLNGAVTLVPFKCVAGTGSFVVTFAGDPGAGTIVAYAVIH